MIEVQARTVVVCVVIVASIMIDIETQIRWRSRKRLTIPIINLLLCMWNDALYSL